MTAYWLVLDHPYFAVTDKDGNFEIKNVPAGTQKLVVWHEAASYVTPTSGESITIKANDATTKDFTIDPAKLKQGG
jgi:Polysaccharide lyase family 4, domain II